MTKSSRNFQDKSGIGYDSHNHTSSSKVSMETLSNVALKRKPMKIVKRKIPKQVWVLKDKIIFLAYVINPNKKTPIIVPGQWKLTIHNGKKVHIPKVEKQEKKLNETFMRTRWRWLYKDETFVFY